MPPSVQKNATFGSSCAWSCRYVRTARHRYARHWRSDDDRVECASILTPTERYFVTRSEVAEDPLPVHAIGDLFDFRVSWRARVAGAQAKRRAFAQDSSSTRADLSRARNDRRRPRKALLTAYKSRYPYDADDSCNDCRDDQRPYLPGFHSAPGKRATRRLAGIRSTLVEFTCLHNVTSLSHQTNSIEPAFRATLAIHPIRVSAISAKTTTRRNNPAQI